MSLPTELKYTKEHEWLKQKAELVVVGITNFAQDELGEVVFFEPPQVGSVVEQGGTLCVVESTKAASDVYAPISGEVVEVNEELESNPGLINSAPYESGWLVKLKPKDLAEVETLLDSAAYGELIGS